MRQLVKPLAILISAFLILSCMRLTREDTNAWLHTKTAGSGIDMSGKWDSGGFTTGGWGEGDFIQEGRHFHGSLGMYYVDGVVTGEQVYMAISSGNRVYYTARLEKMGDGSLTGKAVADVIVDRPESDRAVTYLISLRRMGKP